MNELDNLYYKEKYKNNIYLDNASTTIVDQLILKEMLNTFAINYGNPSSVHDMGKLAKLEIMQSQEKIASFLNCKPQEIYFTSGCSESNNWVLNGILSASKKENKHIITTKIEHKSILNVCKELEKKDNITVTYLDVDKNGLVNLDQLKSSIIEDTVLISIMYVNNEVGTIQNIDGILKIAKKHKVYVHTDATQAVGKMGINLKEIDVDFLTFSGHKIHAPKGIGVLYIKEGSKINPLILGGNQQNKLRAGTENIPYIKGIGIACNILKSKQVIFNEYIKKLQDYMIKKLEQIDDIIITGSKIQRVNNIVSICVKNLSGNAIVLALDTCGIYCSSGSACNEDKITKSYVLEAMGVDEEYIKGSVRFSLSRYNTKEEIDKVITKLKIIIKTLKEL